MKATRIFAACTMICLVLALAAPADADYAGSVNKEDVKGVFKAPGYSPYAGRNFPTKVLWGDTPPAHQPFPRRPGFRRHPRPGRGLSLRPG